MAQNSLKKQEAQLKKLNQKIKSEKTRIEQRFGRQVISQSQLDYADLSNDQINLLAQKIAVFLNHDQNDHS